MRSVGFGVFQCVGNVGISSDKFDGSDDEGFFF